MCLLINLYKRVQVKKTLYANYDLKSRGATPPSGSAVASYVASQAASKAGDAIRLVSGRRTLGTEDLTAQGHGTSRAILGSFLNLLSYCDLLFSSKQLEEDLLNRWVTGQASGLFENSIISWSEFVTILPSDIGQVLKGSHRRMGVKHTRGAGQKLSKETKRLDDGVLGYFRFNLFYLSFNLVYSVRDCLGSVGKRGK